MFGSVLMDVRHAARLLARQPRFSATAVALLAAGIGAAAAVFTLVDTVLIAALPFREPDRVVWMYNARAERDRAPLSIPDLEDYRRDTRTLDDLAAFTNWTANLTGNGDGERFEGVRVSGNFFDLRYRVLRARADGRLLAGAARAAMHAVDPDVALSAARTLEEILAGSVGPRRINARLLELFGESAMLLAALGTYAIAAFAAGTRRRELAIRAACGASRASLVRLIFRGELPPLAVGIGIGLIVAFAAAQSLGDLLFATSPRDPAVYAAVAAAVVAITALATYLPARRAATADLALLRHP